MDAPVRQSDFHPVRFTVDDVYALVAAGVLDDAKVELIDGELVEMADDGALHINWTHAIGKWLYASLPSGYIIVSGSTLRLSASNGPKPDWYVFPDHMATEDVTGSDVLLAIEQSNTSLQIDLKPKADLYARHGVRDYWVIDLNARRLHVHRDPAEEGYGSKQRHEADATVDALLIPGLSIRLVDLDRVN